MFADDMTRLFRRANPNMTEARKLSYLMLGVKEQLFNGLLCNLSSTVVDFIKEETAIEQALRQRRRQHNRMSSSAQFNAATMTFTATRPD